MKFNAFEDKLYDLYRKRKKFFNDLQKLKKVPRHSSSLLNKIYDLKNLHLGFYQFRRFISILIGLNLLPFIIYYPHFFEPGNGSAKIVTLGMMTLLGLFFGTLYSFGTNSAQVLHLKIFLKNRKKFTETLLLQSKEELADILLFKKECHQSYKNLKHSVVSKENKSKSDTKKENLMIDVKIQERIYKEYESIVTEEIRLINEISDSLQPKFEKKQIVTM